MTAKKKKKLSSRMKEYQERVHRIMGEEGVTYNQARAMAKETFKPPRAVSTDVDLDEEFPESKKVDVKMVAMRLPIGLDEDFEVGYNIALSIALNLPDEDRHKLTMRLVESLAVNA